MNAIEILSSTSEQTFAEIVAACSRKVRETLFSRMGVKVKDSGISLQLNKKRDEQAKKLHEKFKHSQSKPESDVAGEIIRNWLYTKRPMLKATLDYLKVPNQDGLVETELDFFKDLSPADSKAVFEHVSKEFNPEHIWIYLSFVEVPSVPRP